MYDGFSAEERRRRFAFKPTTSDVMNVLLQRLCLSLIGGKTLRAAADSGDVVESVLAALREKLSRHKFEFLNGSAEGDLDELEDKLNKTFRSLISPLPVDVAVDEQMIPRDGSEGGTTFDDHREAIGSEFSLVNWVVFMPRKPTANGVLRYILATSLHHTGHGKISYILGSFTNFNKTVPARDAAKVLLLRLRECTPSRQQVRATVDAAFGGVDFAAEMYLKGVDVTAACSSTSNLVSTLFSGLEKRQYRVMERAIGSGMLTLFVYRDNGDMACNHIGESTRGDADGDAAWGRFALVFWRRRLPEEPADATGGLRGRSADFATGGIAVEIAAGGCERCADDCGSAGRSRQAAMGLLDGQNVQ
jgi:hypothetical protein